MIQIVPLVCLDETSKHLIVEMRAPIPAKPGQPVRHDYEYERNGVANIFMVYAPLEGGATSRSPTATPPSITRSCSRNCPTCTSPAPKKTVLVQDNLSTHTAASLYAAFPAAGARRLAKRFEWHYTPKHGS